MARASKTRQTTGKQAKNIGQTAKREKKRKAFSKGDFVSLSRLAT